MQPIEVKEAIKRMRENGEFGRIEKWYRNEEDDTAKAAHVHNLAVQLKDVDDIPFPALVMMLDDVMVLQSILTYMLG